MQSCGKINSSSSQQNKQSELTIACTGINCASNGNKYTGKGLGVWMYENTENKMQPLKISLTGLYKNNVTLVFSNLTEKAQPMPKNLKGNDYKKEEPIFSFNKIDPIPSDLQLIEQNPLEKEIGKFLK